jgi:hypothetical protein
MNPGYPAPAALSRLVLPGPAGLLRPGFVIPLHANTVSPSSQVRHLHNRVPRVQAGACRVRALEKALDDLQRALYAVPQVF